MSNDILEALWVEKWRPKELIDLVLEEQQRTFFEKCLIKEDIPMLLFTGPPGSGKSTLARILCDKLIKNDMDLLMMNGSDQTGVDIVRNEITGFLKCPAISSKLKIVYIDEFDYTTGNYQANLRGVMEKYAEVGRFICTCNYISKVIDPLISRFQVFEMKTIPEDFVMTYCTKILKTEKIEYDENVVRFIVQNLLPDIRKIVNTLQKNIVNGKLSGINKDAIIGTEKKVIALICMICDNIGKPEQDKTINSKVPEIEDCLSKEEIDYISAYGTLFYSNLPLWAKIVVNKYCNGHTSCAIPSIHFNAMVWEIIQSGISYFTMVGGKR